MSRLEAVTARFVSWQIDRGGGWGGGLESGCQKAGGDGEELPGWSFTGHIKKHS